MSERLRYTLLQVLLVAFCELVLVAVIGVVGWAANPAASVAFPWYLPLSLVLIAVLTALPGLLLFDLESAPHWRLRIFLHWVLLGGIVMLAGKLFHWYDTPLGGAVIFGAFCAIYVLVWAVIRRSYQRDDERINERLAQRRSGR